MNPHSWPEPLLSRIEHAGINASAPPQQRCIDGWLLRFSPGKAKRARCVQAVADGRLPLDERLALCAALLHDAGLPLLMRLTPFSRPAGLDDALASRGLHRLDDTRVMVASLDRTSAAPLPGGVRLARLSAIEFAEAVGVLRGSPVGLRNAWHCRPCLGWGLPTPTTTARRKPTPAEPGRRAAPSASKPQPFVQTQVHVHRLHRRTAGALAQVVQA